METPETEINYIPPAEPGMALSQEGQYYLQMAGKWATFLSIMGFIGCGFMLIYAVFAGAIFSAASQFSTGPQAGIMTMIGSFAGIIIFIFTAIAFYINLCLYQFASNAKKAVAFNDAGLLTKTMGKLRSFFKIYGIIVIIFLSFYLLIFIGAIVVGIGSLGHH